MAEYVVYDARDGMYGAKAVSDGELRWEYRERVIRCRDCSWMVDAMGVYECQRFSGEYHSCDPNGFCAWGEPREDA